MRGTLDCLNDAVRDSATVMLEPDAFEFCQALGFLVPVNSFVPIDQVGTPVDVSGHSAERLVLKVVSRDIVHKTDVGGVRFVANEPIEVAQALAAMKADFSACDVAGFSIADFIRYDTGPGSELLVNVRWNREFGAVVTLGLGGVYTDVFGASDSNDQMRIQLLTGIVATEAVEIIAATRLGKLLLEGHRKTATRLTQVGLEKLLDRVMTLAEDVMPLRLRELEINPLIPTPKGALVLDAYVRVGDNTESAPTTRPRTQLHRMLKPQSIAVIGVGSGSNPGRVILQNILAEGFSCESVWVVKPGYSDVEGCRAVENLESIPKRVDLCIVSVAGSQVPGLLKDIVRLKSASAVIVIAGGLGETEPSKPMRREIETTLMSARQNGAETPLVNGGNCLGVRSTPGRYNALFIPAHKFGFPDIPAAPLGIVAQSGAFVLSRSSKLGYVNPRYLISVGNQIDLTVGDFVEHLVDHTDLKVIACYVEGMKYLDGARLIKAARRATKQGCTVILYRAGRNVAGASASASHTAALAGDYSTTRALARQAGILVAESLSEFEGLTTVATLLAEKKVLGRRVGVISNAGFESVAIADHLGGLELSDFSKGTTDRLRTLFAESNLDGFAEVRNPLDVTPMMGDRGFVSAVRTLLADETTDALIIGCVPFTPALNTLACDIDQHEEDMEGPEAIAPLLIDTVTASQKPVVFVVDAGELYDPLAKLFDRAGLPVFRTSDETARVLSVYIETRLASAVTIRDRSRPE